MGFQCVPQIKGLVRGDGMRRDGKGQAKHRANAVAIVNEAFEIADPSDGHAIPIWKSASETYDRSRTVNNKYIGPRTADGVMELLEEEASKQKIDVRTVEKKTGETVICHKAKRQALAKWDEAIARRDRAVDEAHLAELSRKQAVQAQARDEVKTELTDLTARRDALAAQIETEEQKLAAVKVKVEAAKKEADDEIEAHRKAMMEQEMKTARAGI